MVNCHDRVGAGVPAGPSSADVEPWRWVEGGPMVRLVRRLRASALDLGALASALEQPIGEADVEPWVIYDLRAYARTRIAGSERFEVRLLGWLPGQSTDLHGHGAACAFRVIAGVATEVRPGKIDRALPPDTVVVAGEREVHQLENRGPEPLLTLHVYAPPTAPAPPTLGRRIVLLGGGDETAQLAASVLSGVGDPLHLTLVESTDASPWDAAVAARIGDAVRARPGRLRVLRGVPRAVRGPASGVQRVLLDDGRLLVADELLYGSAPRG